MSEEEVKKLAWWAVVYIQKIKEADPTTKIDKSLTDNLVDVCIGKDTLKVDPKELGSKVKQLKKEKFKALWELYNFKKDRKLSEERFLKLSLKDIERIEKTLPAFIESTSTTDAKEGKNFKPKRPLFSVYINRRRWEDEIEKKNEEKKFKYCI